MINGAFVQGALDGPSAVDPNLEGKDDFVNIIE
jgi:hypothetical protein